MSHLQRAIEYFGSKSALARHFGLNPMAVHHWESRGVPAKWCRGIEEATNGLVTKEQLRPDVFGQPTTNEAA